MLFWVVFDTKLILCDYTTNIFCIVTGCGFLVFISLDKISCKDKNCLNSKWNDLLFLCLALVAVSAQEIIEIVAAETFIVP